VEACLFLVVFRLAVKIFGGFTATAKIRLGGYRLRLGGSISVSGMARTFPTVRPTENSTGREGRLRIGWKPEREGWL